MEKPFSLAPISLIRMKMWCYYLWMRCSTTFNSLLFLRPSIFCPTLSFPREIWVGRGSSESFFFGFPCLSLTLSPFLLILLLSFSLIQCYLLDESVSLSLQERWSKVWFYLFLCSQIMFLKIMSRREVFYIIHNLYFLLFFHRVPTNSTVAVFTFQVRNQSWE